ncbi:MAG: MBL fold metallo-hydrolase [Eubacteriales bacterium]|nr:MBL fold metallo-hydrolase [Eubacteriales bacterium]
MKNKAIRKSNFIFACAAVSVMLPNMCGAAAELNDIGNDAYVVTEDSVVEGYVLVGSDQALAISFTEDDLNVPDTELLTDKELLFVNTLQEEQGSYDLGDRTIRAEKLNGAESLARIRYPEQGTPSDSLVYVDEASNTAYTDLSIGNGMAICGGDDSSYMAWGDSYYKLLALQSAAHKLTALTEDMTDAVVMDGEGNSVSTAYIADMTELVDRVMNFDNDLIYEYDHDKITANYIAVNGTATLEFHLPQTGFLGYLLMGTGFVEESYINHQIFAVRYSDWLYFIRDTDVQGSYLIMDDEEALLIDVGHWNGPAMWEKVQTLIGERSLSVYITHAHGDHWYNLQYFDADRIDQVYFPADEVATRVQENEGVYDLNEDLENRFAGKTVRVKDGDVLNVAGKSLEVIGVTGHTPYGTVLLDIEDKTLFCGDALGTQTFGGGSSLKTSTVDTWSSGLHHLNEVLKTGTDECRVEVIYPGHQAYALGVDYLQGLTACVDALSENGMDATLYAPMGKGSQLVVAKNGELITQEELDELFASNITDAEAVAYASVSFVDDTVQ